MASPSSSEHKRRAAERGPVTLAVVTVSDTRNAKTDANGAYLSAAVARSGNRLHSIRIVPDEPAQVEAALTALAAEDELQVRSSCSTGEPEFSRRDRTYDVLSRNLEKELPGFGEIFRMLSYEQVGAAAVLSRAAAGVYRGKVVVSTPGSPAAVRLAWEKLLGARAGALGLGSGALTPRYT